MENHLIQCKVYRYIHINKLRNRIKVVFFKIEKMKQMTPSHSSRAVVSKYFLIGSHSIEKQMATEEDDTFIWFCLSSKQGVNISLPMIKHLSNYKPECPHSTLGVSSR